MKRLLTLSAFVIAAVFAVLAYALPSNELDISFPLLSRDVIFPGSSDPAQTLAAPQLVPTAGEGEITVTWQPVTDANAYELWVRLAAKPWEELAAGTLISTTTIYTHTNLLAGQTYTYAALAVSSSGDRGPWSSEVQATVLADLDAPVLTAAPGPAQVDLTWPAVTDADSYELWAWESVNEWAQIDAGQLISTSTSFSHTNLSVGVEYYYQMRAINADDAPGPWSAQVNLTVSPAMATPVLTATASAGQVTLTWDAVTDAVNYEVWMRQADTDWEQADDGTLTGASTTFTHAGRTAGETYFYTVRAVNASGQKGPWGQQAEATIPTDGLAAPSVTATPGIRQNTLSWDAVAGAATYELWAWEDNTDWYQLDDGSLTATTFNHTSLTVGNTYHYSLRALSSDGDEGPWSEYVEATVLGDLTTPVLTATASNGQVVLTWLAVPGAHTYELWAGDSVNGWQRLDDGSLSANNFTHNDGTAGTEYLYSVRAHASDGKESAWSVQVNATP